MWAAPLVLLLAVGALACPDVCECSWKVDCSNMGFVSVPIVFYESDDTFFVFLSENKLSTLHPREFFKAGYGRVQELYLAKNSIYSISEDAFRGLSRLERLDLNDNQLQTVSKQTFGPLSSMRYLHLSGNPLSAITGTSYLAPPLRILYMNECNVSKLEDLFRPPADEDTSWLETLRYVYLSDNNISCISRSMLSFVKERSLQLAGNPLQCDCVDSNYRRYVFPAVVCNNASAMPENSTELIVTSTTTTTAAPKSRSATISSIPGTDAPSTYVDSREKITFQNVFSCVSKNLVANYSGRSINSSILQLLSEHGFKSTNSKSVIYQTVIPGCSWTLRQLHLDHNVISSVPTNTFDALKDLQMLDLSWNLIHAPSRLIFSQNTKLKWLNLAHNPLEYFHDSHTPVGPPLETLNLSHCRLGDFPAYLFQSHGLAFPWGRSLRILDVSNNSITKLPYFHSYELPVLEVLNMSGNPVHCDEEKNKIRALKFVCTTCENGVCSHKEYFIQGTSSKSVVIATTATIVLMVTVSVTVYWWIRKTKHQPEIRRHILEEDS